MIKYAWNNKNTFYIIISIFKYILHNHKNKFVNKINFIYSRQSCDWSREQRRTRSSSVNKSPSESMSFITEVICKFIFTDVLMKQLPSELGFSVFFSPRAPCDTVSPMCDVFHCLIWFRCVPLITPRLVLYLKCCLPHVSLSGVIRLHGSATCVSCLPCITLLWIIKDCLL